MTKIVTLAVVLPCYNEEAVLHHSAERLLSLFDNMMEQQLIATDSRIVFVDDGSIDQTWRIISELHDKYPLVRGIRLAGNVGHQNAIMAGMKIAKEWADAVITIDADLQDDIECIPKMVKEMMAGNEIVYSIKSCRKGDPVIKRLSAQAFYKVQNMMGIKSIYNHADFRLMTRQALNMLEEYDERNLYLRGIIPQIGLPSTTVDDFISQREKGKSKYTFSRMFSLAVDGITSFSVKPLYSIIYIGLFFLIISTLIGIHTLYAYLSGQTVAGWTSIMLSIWIVGSFILIALGITCIYIGKIFNEVKHRPLYHVYEIL